MRAAPGTPRLARNNAVDVTKYLEKASEATNRRNYDYAIELYLTACKMDPNNVIARRSLRAVENRMWQEKGSSFLGKTKVNTVLFPGLNSLYMMKKWDSAMEKAEEILKIDPTNCAAMMTLGKAAKAAGYNACATAMFEDVKNLNAGGNNKMLIEAARELAHLYELDNRVQEALDVWGQVSKQVPGDREASQKWRDLSAKNVTSIIENASKDGKRGSVARLTQTDDQRKAASKLDLEKGDIKSEADMEAIVAHTNDEIAKCEDERTLPKLYEKLGNAYRQFGRYEESKSAFESAREKDPNNPAFLFKLHDLEIWRMQSELKSLEPGVKAGDTAAKEQYVKQRELYLDYRLNSFLDREKQYPTDSKIRFDLGAIYFDLAEKRKDRALYDEALKRFQSTFKDPKFRTESGLKLGICFDAKGQYDLALKRFDETLAGFPVEIKDDKWKSIMYYKAVTLTKHSKIEDSLKIFYDIYEVDVSFKDVDKMIQELESRKGS